MMLAKAQEFLAAAKFNLEGEQYGTVLNRAYYAVFTCSQLMLFLEGINVKTHAGNHRKFSETFIKTDLVLKKYGRMLNELYELRQATDYDAFSFAEREDAEEA
ncbi:MAG: HEPN domain-containing protein [Bacteroidota bacterium]